MVGDGHERAARAAFEAQAAEACTTCHARPDEPALAGFAVAQGS